jgi:NAD+ synthase (glutamine-hydrolysing)
MLEYGFVRVAAAVPITKVADCEYNAQNITEMICKAESEGIQFIVFPELSVTAYSCGDLFHQDALINHALLQFENILNSTAGIDIVSIIGMPIYAGSRLFNCAVVINRGKILGIVPKTYIRSCKGYNEERWFASGTVATDNYIRILNQEVPFGTNLLFNCSKDSKLCFGIEISGDLWAPIPLSSYHTLSGASIIFNLSATFEEVGLNEFRQDLVRMQSAKCNSAYVYVSSGINESTTDGVYCGHGIIAENGTILSETERFLAGSQLIYTDIDIERLTKEKVKNSGFTKGMVQLSIDNSMSSWINPNKYRKIGFILENPQLKYPNLRNLCRHIYPYPFVPSDEKIRDKRCNEVFEIQIAGITKRIMHTKSKHAVIGVSGGLDSTLALLVTANSFDKMSKPREDIIGITMPGFGTTKTTYENAIELMKNLGVSIREIDIIPACLQHFKDIKHDLDIHDVTYENVQARERYQILMDIANKEGGLVIGAGDLSELALGWCTYNGDHMSMYNVNCGVPKTLVRYLINWAANNKVDDKTKDVLLKVVNTPISPELLPPTSKGEIKQKTEDIIGPYELHDFFLYYMVRYGMRPRKILFLAEHAFKDKYPRDIIKKWLEVFLKRFFRQQFKRSCMPDGPRIGSVSLSPRGGWSMPSDAEGALWLKEIREE